MACGAPGAGDPPAALRAWTTTGLRHAGETVATRLRPGAGGTGGRMRSGHLRPLCLLAPGYGRGGRWRHPSRAGHPSPAGPPPDGPRPTGRHRAAAAPLVVRRPSTSRAAPVPTGRAPCVAARRGALPPTLVATRRHASGGPQQRGHSHRDNGARLRSLAAAGREPVRRRRPAPALGGACNGRGGRRLRYPAPEAALTYAEAGAWGRALVMEGRRRRIPVIGMQHGFIDRHVLGYLHDPDEMQPSRTNAGDIGYPLPDTTLLFDAFAAAHLRARGTLPSRFLRIVGSPKLDHLASRVAAPSRERLDAARTDLGAADGQDIVLIASKFTEIRPLFGALVDAVRLTPSVHAVVKCHPEEAPDPYRKAANGVPKPDRPARRNRHGAPSALVPPRGHRQFDGGLRRDDARRYPHSQSDCRPTSARSSTPVQWPASP